MAGTKAHHHRPWLIVERLDDEVLVYDQRTHHAHALSGATAWLFDHEGEPIPSRFSKAELESAKRALRRLGLGREAISRRAFFGAAAGIATIVAPTTAQAVSCTHAIPCTPQTVGTQCTTPLAGLCGQCQATLTINGVVITAGCNPL